MARKKTIDVALVYDFDGTLSPGNMQEFGFVQAIGKDSKEFWRKNHELAEQNDANEILCYMYLMLQEAKANNISLKRKSFKQFGAQIELFRGVEEWFALINEYGKSIGLNIKHYINSSGLREMIEGTKIAKRFENIYACSFLYDVDGIAYWPAVAVDYTTKTQFLFKINKGIKEIRDNKKINEYLAKEERPIPFERMIYFGDGETDKDRVGKVAAFVRLAVEGGVQHHVADGENYLAAVGNQEIAVNHLLVVEMLVNGQLDRGRAFVFGVIDGIEGAFLEYQLGVVGTYVAVLCRKEASAVAAQAFDGVVAEGDEDGALKLYVLVENHAAGRQVGTVIDLFVCRHLEADEFDSVAMTAAMDGVVCETDGHHFMPAHSEIAVDRFDPGIHQACVPRVTEGLDSHGVEPWIFTAESNTVGRVEEVEVELAVGAVAFVEMQQKAECFGIRPCLGQLLWFEGLVGRNVEARLLCGSRQDRHEKEGKQESLHKGIKSG